MAIDEAVTLKKMEVFLAFMKTNNMAQVAQLLGQSTVSVHRSLHSLEEALCCTLLKRDGRSQIPLATATTFFTAWCGVSGVDPNKTGHGIRDIQVNGEMFCRGEVVGPFDAIAIARLF